MHVRTLLAACVASLTIGVLSSASAQEEKSPRYVALDRARGLYSEPASGTATTAFLAIHRTSDFLLHPTCRELPKRGYAALCMNTRFVNNEAAVDWDRIALDVKAGVEFLRAQEGIEHVVLLGHSGGGPTLSFYQAVAENGLGFCQDSRKLVPCKDDLADLPAADGLILADAHPGVPVILLRSLNGAVLDETPGRFDPSLDPYRVENGYDSAGSSNYSPEFQERYFAAQSARMNRLIEVAEERMRAIRAGAGPYPDNDIFVIPHGGNPGPGPGGASQLHSLDTSVALRSTSRPRKLLKNDGSIVEEVVVSVSPAELDTKESTSAFDRGTKLLTLRSFLSTQAVRSRNSLDGIDHCSSNNSTICALASIEVPVLVAGMGGYLFIRDAEEEFEAAATDDKDLIYIEGATHGFSPCVACNPDPLAFSNSEKNLFDYVADWTSRRFGR